jgi:hypothetical protein
MAEAVIGTFIKSGTTKNFVKYSRENKDTGRTDTQYVANAVAESLGNPDAIEVVAKAR